MKQAESFNAIVNEIRSQRGYIEPFAFGIGLARFGKRHQLLEVYYPLPCYRCRPEIAALLARAAGYLSRNLTATVERSALEEIRERLVGAPEFARDPHSALLAELLDAPSLPYQRTIVTLLAEDRAIESIEEAYLKLYLLSHRQVLPNELNLSGIFRVLPTVAWTSAGPIEAEELGTEQFQARLRGESLEVYSIDKFPKLINVVAPSEVRIADGARVRLGAYLGPGTTIMHEGFVNFNAGTEGPNMVEGRISAGVYVGAGSDLGGGSSTMGTLSGGNDVLISLGKNSLLGANAGTGIPLGDNCIVEAGLYLTAGTKVELLDLSGKKLEVVSARDLGGRADLLFRRNSMTGAVQALPNKRAVKLNPDLHQRSR